MANPHARGQQRDKPFLAALRIEVAEAGSDPLRLRRIAKKLLNRAEEGDVRAIQEVADRLDGKVPQAITGDDDGSPVSVRFVIEGVTPRKGDDNAS
jgi:hypothetical protein